ncbi:hypothetical protein KI387_004285, partial [Taxus chinensis]
TIPAPFSPSANLEIDAPVEGQREIERENIPKRRRLVRKIKIAEPSVLVKEIPSSAAASVEPIFVSDGDSSPTQEKERTVRRSSRKKFTTGHVELPQIKKIHKRSRETLEERSEQERMEEEVADILGSMAMTPPEPSQ